MFTNSITVSNGQFSKLAKAISLEEKNQECTKLANITQSNLADTIGKPQSYVSKIESGERRFEPIELHVILTALNVSLEEFLTDLQNELKRFRTSRTGIISLSG